MQNVETRFFSWQLTRYLAKEVLFGFIFGTLIFIFILLMFQAIRLSEFMVVHQVALKDIGRIWIFLMVSFLPVAIPVAFLFSVLMGISRANTDGEILAMQANGVSLPQLFAPLFIFSFFVSLFCLYTSFYLGPQGNRKFEVMITRLTHERAISTLRPGVFTGFHGLTLFAEQIQPLKNEMRRVFIYDEREGDHPLAITAQAGILKNVPEQGVLTLRLSNGAIHVDRKQTTDALQKIEFDVYDINLDVPLPGVYWRDYSPQSYTYDHFVTRLKETEHDVPLHRKILVEYHRRFALSFACMVLAGLGFFIGVFSQRGVRSTAILICLGVGVAYWLAYVGANAAATTGTVWPWFGVWFPNFLFAAIAFWSYRRVRIGR